MRRLAGQVMPTPHRFQEKGLLCSSLMLLTDSRADQLTSPKSTIINYKNIDLLSEGIQQFATHTIFKDSPVPSNLSTKLSFPCNITVEFVLKMLLIKIKYLS